jgi:hypothetical protein
MWFLSIFLIVNSPPHFLSVRFKTHRRPFLKSTLMVLKLIRDQLLNSSESNFKMLSECFKNGRRAFFKPSVTSCCPVKKRTESSMRPLAFTHTTSGFDILLFPYNFSYLMLFNISRTSLPGRYFTFVSVIIA